MPKLVCVKCHTELKIEKTGAYALEMFNKPPRPYKLWSADAWRCPGCGYVVLAGFPHEPLVEHYEEKFERILERVRESETAVQGWLIEDHERPQGD